MWDAFKREIKRQFYLEDVTYLARKNMKCLKHTGLIHEFVNEFSMLMLEIPNMSEEELLFNFMDNFLCHMERYFEAIALMDEATKVRTTTVYLLDNATLWWCWRFGDIEKRTYTIDMWDAFKREIKRQFYLEDVAYLARKNMKCLKHTGLIREFVKEFFMLMLEIPNMFKEELLLNFLDNLQSWVEQELRRRGVQDLTTAMAVVESLVEYKRGDSSKRKPQSKGNHAKGGGDEGSWGYTPREGSSKGPTGKDSKGKDKRKKFMPRTNCFLCDGPH